jgi:hypothetical protein
MTEILKVQATKSVGYEMHESRVHCHALNLNSEIK